MSTDDRRTMALDISHDMVGNFEYFKELIKCTEDNTVGEAFFWFCKEFEQKNRNWNEFLIPFTETKSKLIIENLHPLHVFIKEKFIFRSTFDRDMDSLDGDKVDGINLLYGDFYSEYVKYCTLNKKPVLGKIQMSEKLKLIKLNITSGNANKQWLRYTRDQLFDIYKAKNWISEFDEAEYIDNAHTKDVFDTTPYIGDIINSANELKKLYKLHKDYSRKYKLQYEENMRYLERINSKKEKKAALALSCPRLTKKKSNNKEIIRKINEMFDSDSDDDNDSYSAKLSSTYDELTEMFD